MKNTLSLLFVASLFAASCGKPRPNPYEQPLSYSVAGISDVTVAANDFSNFPAEINVYSGNPYTESVSASYTGVPANVSIKYHNASFKLSDLPTGSPGVAGFIYMFTDSIAAQNAIPGTYPMQVTFSHAASTPKAYSFNLIITDPVNWMQKLLGYYYPSPQTLGSQIYVSCEIDSVAGMPGKIRIIDRVSPEWSTYGTFDTSYGTMDCCSGSFTIPSQTVHGTTVEGKGYYINEGGQRRWMLNRNYTNGATSFNSRVTLRH
jgi:hypothetical protein